VLRERWKERNKKEGKRIREKGRRGEREKGRKG
jgi:hypothetical protein